MLPTPTTAQPEVAWPRRRLLRGALLAAGSASVLAACGRRPAEVPGRRVDYSDIDQAPAVAKGPVGVDLPDTPTLRRIRQRGTLLQSGVHTFPGFGLENPRTGEITGFDAGMAQLLAKYLLGRPSVDTAVGSADAREALLQNHSVDAVVSTYTISASRARLVNFAGPYLVVRSGVAVAADESGVRTLADLAGQDVAVQPGAAEDALRKAVPGANPVRFDETTQCAAAVRQGRVRAWSANTAILLGRCAVDPRIRATDIVFGHSPFGIGLPKDDPEFKQVVGGFLRQIMADGTWRSLWELTVGVLLGASTPAPRPPALGSEPGS